MKTWLKWSLLGLSLLLITPPLLLFSLDHAYYKPWISRMVEAKTGRPLWIEGDLKLTFGGKPKISAEDIRYPNAEWGAHKWAIEADKAVFSLDLRALLQGQLQVEEIVLQKPVLRVEKNDLGLYNLAIVRPPEYIGRGAALPKWLNISDAEIVDGEITVNVRNRHWEIDIHHARAESAGRDKPTAVDFRGEIEQTPVTASGTLGSLEALFGFQPSPLSVDAQVGVEGNRIRADGSVKNLFKWYGVDLDLTFVAAQTGVLSALANATLSEVGTVHGRARLDQPGLGSGMALRELELNSNKFGLTSVLTGEIDKIFGLRGVSLNLAVDGPIDQVIPKLAHLGPVTATAEVTREKRFWNLRNIMLSQQRDTLSATATGLINHLNGDLDGRLNVIAEAADGRYVQPLFDNPLPPLSGVELEADVLFDRSVFRAEVSKVETKMYGVDLSASGTIDDISGWRGIDLDVIGHADSLERLPPMAGRTPPRSGPVRIRAGLADDPSGKLHLTNIIASATDPLLDLNVRGEVRDIGESIRANLDLRLKLAAAEPLRPWLAYPESVSGLVEMAMPLQITAKLHPRGWDDWQIRDLTAVSSADGIQVELSGEITEFTPLEARLHIDLDRLATSRFAQSHFPLLEKNPWPPDGTLSGVLDLVAEKGEVSLKNIDIALDAALDSADATMTLHGAINRLNPLEISHMKLDFEADSMAVLGWSNIASLNPDIPVSGSVNVATGARGNHSEVRLNMGESDLRGTLEWRLPGDGQALTWVQAELVSERLDLAEIQLPGAKKRRLFSPEPFNTDWIRKLTGKIDLSAAYAGNRIIGMRDVKVSTVLDRGTLRQDISGRMGQGMLTASLAVNAAAEPTSVEFNLDGKHLDTAGLPTLHKDNYLDNGTFDVDIDFSAEGGSMADLAVNAAGGVSLRLHEARMKNESLDIIGGDIFSNLVIAINPFRSIGEYVDIECGIIRFNLADGVATTNGLAVKTDRATVLGAGSIDLKDESLEILISPKARTGFGINSVSLANMIQLGGTLAEPKIEADGNRLLQTGATLWAAFYTGGLSVLAQGLLNLNKANANVCGLAETAKVEQRGPNFGSGGDK